jgi:diketogulonate reductase-like aldo/keto reductase
MLGCTGAARTPRPSQREVIVIPKSVRRDRMAEDLNVFDFALGHPDR